MSLNNLRMLHPAVLSLICQSQEAQRTQKSLRIQSQNLPGHCRNAQCFPSLRDLKRASIPCLSVLNLFICFYVGRWNLKKTHVTITLKSPLDLIQEIVAQMYI